MKRTKPKEKIPEVVKQAREVITSTYCAQRILDSLLVIRNSENIDPWNNAHGYGAHDGEIYIITALLDIEERKTARNIERLDRGELVGMS